MLREITPGLSEPSGEESKMDKFVKAVKYNTENVSGFCDLDIDPDNVTAGILEFVDSIDEDPSEVPTDTFSLASPNNVFFHISGSRYEKETIEAVIRLIDKLAAEYGGKKVSESGEIYDPGDTLELFASPEYVFDE